MFFFFNQSYLILGKNIHFISLAKLAIVGC